MAPLDLADTYIQEVATMAADTARKSLDVHVKNMPSIDEIVAALTKVAKMEPHEPLTITYEEFTEGPIEQRLVLNAVTSFSSSPFSEHLRIEALDEHWTSVTVSFKPPGYGEFATIERP